MFKNLLFTSFLLLNLIGIIYPSKKQDTKLFDYCYSLEKILSRNSLEKSKKVSGHEPIGGSFTIDFLVKRKHNIDYIYQDIEQSDIGFWASRDASSLLLASCGQLLNIYNEDYRSDTT